MATLRARYILDVEYALEDGASAEDLPRMRVCAKDLLGPIGRQLAGEGRLSGSTDLIVETWIDRVEFPPAAEVARHG